MYKYGVIGPTAGGEGRPSQRILPEDAVAVSSGIGINDYTREGVEDGMSRYWDCVDAVVKGGAQRIFEAASPSPRNSVGSGRSRSTGRPPRRLAFRQPPTPRRPDLGGGVHGAVEGGRKSQGYAAFGFRRSASGLACLPGPDAHALTST